MRKEKWYCTEFNYDQKYVTKDDDQANEAVANGGADSATTTPDDAEEGLQLRPNPSAPRLLARSLFTSIRLGAKVARSRTLNDTPPPRQKVNGLQNCHI